jgi:hypothetical protein
MHPEDKSTRRTARRKGRFTPCVAVMPGEAVPVHPGATQPAPQCRSALVAIHTLHDLPHLVAKLDHEPPGRL